MWEGEVDSDGEDTPAAAAAKGKQRGGAPPEWAQVPTQETVGKTADLV